MPRRTTSGHRERGILQRVRPDETLAAIVGARAASRPEMMKRVWSYIKAHDLQDARDGRVIHPDAQLRRVFGNKRELSMFDIPRGINAHLV